MAAGGVEVDVKSLEDLQEKTLISCHEVLKKKLDVKEIYSQMNQRNLLTSEDRHFLQDTSKSPETKVSHIIEMLPRKESGWWEKLIDCLEASTSGTAHEYLASTLTNQLKRKMYECGQQFRRQPHGRERKSAHVPSGISLDICDFMPDSFTPPTGYLERNNTKESPDIAELRPDLADVLIPIVQLKEKLDTTKYNYKIMKNQVGLLQAFDELIENTKRFGDALSDLLKLYIDKFKTKKRHNYSQLTEVERNVIQLIEDITESTEDIDIEKEKEVWSQCIEKMEKNRDLIKEALYSQETSKMATLQRYWKLNGEDSKNAEEWIAVRKQVVLFGNDCLVKLDKLRNQDNVLITSIYDIVYTRVKVGENCLKAWIKWVGQRTKLGSSNYM